MEKLVGRKAWKAAANVAKNIELIDVLCTHAEFDNGSNLFPKKFEQKYVKLTNKFLKFEYQEKDSILINFTRLGFRYMESPEGPKISISAILVCRYKLTTNPPPEQLREFFFKPFSEINSLFHIWPYWRETVHSAMCRMGLPQLTLPVVLIKPRMPIENKTSSKVKEPGGPGE